MNKQEQNFIGLVVSTLGGAYYEPVQPDYTAILHLAQQQGVSYLLCDSIFKLPSHLQPEKALMAALKRSAYTAAVRESLQEEEISELEVAFEKNGLTGILLKGAVLKKLYPRADYRYMSDVDILIDPVQAQAVKDSMMALGWSVAQCTDATDIYLSPNHIKYELHKDLGSESFNAETAAFSSGLFHACCGNDRPMGLLEPPKEIHYAYILCHFVKHLLNGGIGIRQVMDVYFCRKGWKMDEARLTELLGSLKLYQFSKTVEKLANSWFSDAGSDPVTEELGRYLLGSGVFGTEEQKVADRMLKADKKKNKITYVFSRLFPGYGTMCFYYPVLKKHPYLLPVFWIWRLIYALVFRRKKLMKEVSAVGKTDQAALLERALFYQRCGLNVYTKD